MKTNQAQSVSKRSIDLFIVLTTWLAIIIMVAMSENIVNTFSYFTVLSNLIIALSLTVTLVLPVSKLGRFLTNISVQSSLVEYIIIVSLIYNLFIRSSWIQPVPEFFYNNILHVVTPVLYVLRWILFVPKGKLRLSDSFKWLVFPFAYLFYSLIRGSIVNWYPYFFIDLRDISYIKASENIFFVILLFLLIGLLIVFIDNKINKQSTINEFSLGN
nr:Pr6Pr family membrane protein [uncultured Carboxylicivirga sp.]